MVEVEEIDVWGVHSMVSRIQKCKRRQKRSNILMCFDSKALQSEKWTSSKYQKKILQKNCPKNQKNQNLRNHVPIKQLNYIKVSWVMEFLACRYKISLILSKKINSLQGNCCILWIDITPGTPNWWILSLQCQFSMSKIIFNIFLFIFLDRLTTFIKVMFC